MRTRHPFWRLWLMPLTAGFAVVLPVAGQSPAAPEPDLVIGKFGSNVAFFRIAGVVADSDRIWVLDEGNKRVEVFDQRGQRVLEIGREGAGPGEFKSPVGLARTPDGIAVFDLRLQRLTYFDADGEVLETHGTSLSASEHGWLYRLERVPDGTFVAELRTGCGYPRRPERDGRLRIVSLDSEGEIRDTLLSTARRDRLPYYGDLAGSEFCTALRAPHPHHVLWDVAPGGELALADGRQYTIEVKSAAGLSQIRRPAPAAPVTPADRDRFRSSFLRPELPPDELRYLTGYLDQVEFPARRAAIDGLLFDSRGRLWVRRAPGPNDRLALWEALDQGGKTIRSIRLPAGLDVRAITDLGFIGIVADPELEVQQVVRYPLR